jgi:hypothetical protein
MTRGRFPLVATATRTRSVRAAIIVAALLAGGCRRNAVPPESTPEILDLTSRITQAGGHVLIGFKEAKAAHGRDIRGTVVVSDATQARAKAYLREQGVTITQAFTLLPAVRARLDATPVLVARLRANPNIDYIEPGEFD